eukprot:6230451-Ditylum_brightwellii.AAC.1
MESPLWSSQRIGNVQGEEYDPSLPSWSTTLAINDANDAFGAKHILLSIEKELAADIGAMPPGT